jgi:hypothetical protein
MQKTFPLDTGALNAPIRETIGGQSVELYPSPHDLPLTVAFNQDDRTSTITFEYVSSGEPMYRFVLDPRTSLQLGAHSGRVYKVGFPTPQTWPEAAAVERLIGIAIDQLAGGPRGGVRQANYRAVKTVLAMLRSDLFVPWSR